jgi:hypothetical protein
VEHFCKYVLKKIHPEIMFEHIGKGSVSLSKSANVKSIVQKSGWQRMNEKCRVLSLHGTGFILSM